MKYPKIETLYERDEATHKVIDGRLRCPEFGLVKSWLVTEKVDGTNVRVIFKPEVYLADGTRGPAKATQVTFGGRTDNAQMPTFLLAYLQETFTPEGLSAAFPDDAIDTVILFGEGYGARIQKGGGDYRDGVSFRLFDVLVWSIEGQDWWLNWFNVEDVAAKLGIELVPVIGGGLGLETAVSIVTGESRVAIEDKQLTAADAPRTREGIVARTEPLLFDRRGNRVMWKLKGRDLPGHERSK